MDTLKVRSFGYNYCIATFMNPGAVTLSPSGVAPVCIGDQLELMCTTTGSALDWRFRVFMENETTATDIRRVFVSSL